MAEEQQAEATELKAMIATAHATTINADLLTATERETNIHDTNVRFRELLDGVPSGQAVPA